MTTYKTIAAAIARKNPRKAVGWSDGLKEWYSSIEDQIQAETWQGDEPEQLYRLLYNKLVLLWAMNLNRKLARG